MAEHRLGLVEGLSSGSLSGARAFVEGGPRRSRPAPAGFGSGAGVPRRAFVLPTLWMKRVQTARGVAHAADLLASGP